MSFFRVALVGVSILITGCTYVSPGIQRNFDSSAYTTFFTPTPLRPFRAFGSAYFTYSGKGNSGDVVITHNRNSALQLHMTAPFTGAVLMDVRMNDDLVMVMNYTNKTFFQGENNTGIRKWMLSVDITPAEFLILITGRISKPVFNALGGVMEEDKVAVLNIGEIQYRFELNNKGLPSRWSKKVNGEERYRVEYKSYLLTPVRKGPPILVPNKVFVYLKEEKPVLKLGIRDFKPGMGPGKTIEFSLPDSDDGWQREVPQFSGGQFPGL